jgi:hypothetical protein
MISMGILTCGLHRLDVSLTDCCRCCCCCWVEPRLLERAERGAWSKLCCSNDAVGEAHDNECLPSCILHYCSLLNSVVYLFGEKTLNDLSCLKEIVQLANGGVRLTKLGHEVAGRSRASVLRSWKTSSTLLQV